ncbi:MAG: V-type ATP synthase subunit A, partial [Sphaerochaetaceae bacterium]|nr:V-type ATP synthase subunit A [Sphaerochaetaceae bacterium]
ASVTIGGTVSPAGGNFEEPVTQATLKVVGAFHGLSRERSDARKYPAINPLESWSKYPGIIEAKKVEQARSILFRGNEINQMMKVVGEEGTSVNDYIIYQKGELLDSVYLQQNSFDPVDSAVLPSRQKEVFNLLYEVLTSDFNLKDKKEVRQYFNQMRQHFLDWNNVEMESGSFKQLENSIKDLFSSKATVEAK